MAFHREIPLAVKFWLKARRQCGQLDPQSEPEDRQFSNIQEARQVLARKALENRKPDLNPGRDQVDPSRNKLE